VNRTWPTTRVLQTSFPVSGFPANPQADGEGPKGLSVTVLYTTVPATLRALRRAGELATQLGARIRILIPQVVSYPLPLDRPQVDPEFKVRRFRTVSVDGAVETRIDVVLCREACSGITQNLDSQSIVLIGGCERWWPTREKRLAKRLRLAGHHVIWVPEH
jgi:hypothetical protein